MKKSNKDIVTESTPLMPRDSAKLISRLAKDVFIEEEGVKNISCEVLFCITISFFFVILNGRFNF